MFVYIKFNNKQFFFIWLFYLKIKIKTRYTADRRLFLFTQFYCIGSIIAQIYYNLHQFMIMIFCHPNFSVFNFYCKFSIQFIYIDDM